MTTTPFLGLTTYDTASGSSVTFLTYRLSQAGLSSNMTTLDTFASATSASIVSLKSNAVPVVNATQISTNYYEGSNGVISGYLTNMLVDVKLSASISGSTTININTFGVRAIRKISTGGSKVELVSNDMTLNKYYLVVYDGTDFVLAIYDTGTVYTGSAPIAVSSNIISHNTSGITSGSYNKVIVDQFGHVTAGSQIAGMSGSLIFYSGSSSSASQTTILNTVNITNGLITSWTQV